MFMVGKLGVEPPHIKKSNLLLAFHGFGAWTFTLVIGATIEIILTKFKTLKLFPSIA